MPGNEEKAFGLIASPGHFRFRFVLFPWPIWKGKFHRQFSARCQRLTAFDEQASAADAAGQAVELFSFRRGVFHFDGQGGAGMRSRMREANIFVARRNAFDDVIP